MIRGQGLYKLNKRRQGITTRHRAKTSAPSGNWFGKVILNKRVINPKMLKEGVGRGKTEVRSRYAWQGNKVTGESSGKGRGIRGIRPRIGKKRDTTDHRKRKPLPIQEGMKKTEKELKGGELARTRLCSQIRVEWRDYESETAPPYRAKTSKEQRGMKGKDERQKPQSLRSLTI